MSRACFHCGARLSRLAEHCPSCGGRNEAERPWYLYGLGGLIVLLLFLWAGDFGPLVRIVGDLIAAFGR